MSTEEDGTMNEEHRTIAAEILFHMEDSLQLIYDFLGTSQDVTSIDQVDLDTLRISVGADIDWHADSAIDFEPRFCEPFPAKRFDRLWDYNRRNRRDHFWRQPQQRADDDDFSFPSDRLGQGLFLEPEITGRLGWKSGTHNIAFHGAWSTSRIDGWRWFEEPHSHTRYGHGDAEWVMDTGTSVVPRKDRHAYGLPWNFEEILRRKVGRSDYHDEIMVHCSVTVFNNVEPQNDVILFSEVTAAFTRIAEKICLPRNWGHAIYPVIVSSFSGFDVRMLQFHLDIRTQRMYVRKTPYLHINDEFDTENVKLYLRWLMNKPIGDTWLRDEESVEEEYAEECAPKTALVQSIDCH